MSNLKGKVAIVTGAAQGIGKATAEFLAECGASVAAIDINVAGAQLVAERIKAKGGQSLALAADISQPAQVESMVGRVAQHFGRIDVLHNNAAATGHDTIGRDTDVVSIDLDVWDRTFTVNLRGMMLVCKHAIPHMLRGGGGSIINMSSTDGLLPATGTRVAYATSKAAICMLTRHIAGSFGKQGLRCNAIAPGATLTEALKSQFNEEVLATVVKRYMTPYLGEPMDIAQLVAFLASDASRFITGQIITADGGALAHQAV